jgi:hypothetical protein
MMSWVKSGDLIVIVVLGGMGTLFGPLYGAIAFFALEESLPPLLDLGRKGWGEYWQIAFGPMLVLVALYAKGGIDLCSGAVMAEPLLSTDRLIKRFGGLLATDRSRSMSGPARSMP